MIQSPKTVYNINMSLDYKGGGRGQESAKKVSRFLNSP